MPPQTAQVRQLPSPDDPSQPQSALPPPLPPQTVTLPAPRTAPVSGTDLLRKELTDLSQTIKTVAQNTDPASRRQYEAFAVEVDGYRREFETMLRSHNGAKVPELMERIHRTEQNFYNLYGTPDVTNGAVTHPTGSITVSTQAVQQSLVQAGAPRPMAEAIDPGLPTARGAGSFSAAHDQLIAQLDQLKSEGGSFWSNRQGYRTRGPVFERQIETYKRSVEAIFEGTSHKNIRELVAEIGTFERGFRSVAGGAAIVTVSGEQLEGALRDIGTQRAAANAARNKANETAADVERRETLGNRVLDSLGDKVSLVVNGKREGGWHVRAGDMEMLFRRDAVTREYSFADITGNPAELKWTPVCPKERKPEYHADKNFFAALIDDLHRITSGVARPSDLKGPEPDQHQFLHRREQEAGVALMTREQVQASPAKMAFEVLSNLEPNLEYLGPNYYRLTLAPVRDPAHNTPADQAAREAKKMRLDFIQAPTLRHELLWKNPAVDGPNDPWHSTGEVPFPGAPSRAGLQTHFNELVSVLDMANRGGGFEGSIIAAWGMQDIPSEARTAAALTQLNNKGEKVLLLFGARPLEKNEVGKTIVHEVVLGDAQVLVKQDTNNHWVWAVKPADATAPQWRATDTRLEPKNGMVASRQERYINQMLDYLDRLNVEFARGAPAVLQPTP